jgi:taurine dioxygenase
MSDPIEVLPLSGALGAEVRGVDLAQLDDDACEAVHRAFLDHGIVFLRGQSLSREEQLAFARRFGSPEVHPIVDGMEAFPEVIRIAKPRGERSFFGTAWHTDNSFLPKPSSITFLYADTVPAFGGDTLFASMETAWAALSGPMRRFLAPLRAVHSGASAYDPGATGEAKYRGETAITYTYSDAIYEEAEHPVMRTHPETGRQSLYVNATFTQRIVGLAKRESDALLAMLCAHAARPEFTCRLRWEPGTLTLWDNRCVQHCAVDDYEDFERVMYRVTIEGGRPA